MAGTLADRNARLDALASAAQDWATAATAELNNRVTSAKTILQGRTGSETLAQSAVSATSDLVASEIDDFLVGT
jgi:hypothetical protein